MPKAEKVILTKVGLGLGLDYRHFFNNSIYWGTSMTIGRFFTDTGLQLFGTQEYSNKPWFDVEFLKIGIAI